MRTTIYTVVTSESVDDLVERVNGYLNNGGTLVGGMTLSHLPNMAPVMGQALLVPLDTASAS